MDNNVNKTLGHEHDGPPQDEQTKNKIEKHLSDINSTISEQDIKNINTSIGGENIPATPHRDPDEEDEINKVDENNDDEPKEEMPTTWDIKGG